MEISKLRSRITIQQAVVQKDAIGNHTNAWVDFWSCAAYANLASGERVRGRWAEPSAAIPWCSRCAGVSGSVIWTAPNTASCSAAVSTTLLRWTMCSSGMKS